MTKPRCETLRLIGPDDEEPSRTVSVEYRPLTGRGTQRSICYFALIADGERVGTLTHARGGGRVRITQLRTSAARILGAHDAKLVAA